MGGLTKAGFGRSDNVIMGWVSSFYLTAAQIPQAGSNKKAAMSGGRCG